MRKSLERSRRIVAQPASLMDDEVVEQVVERLARALGMRVRADHPRGHLLDDAWAQGIEAEHR